MRNAKDTAKVIGALVLGGLIGAGLGILFAPDKGVNTRKKIKDGAKGLADDVKHKIQEEAEVLKHKAEKIEKMAEDKLHEMRTGEKVNHVA